MTVAGTWLVLGSRSLDRSLVYSYGPGDVVAGRAGDGDVRVGGQVAPGSLRWDPDRRVLRFVLRDDRASIAVVQRGAPPALFQAGQGAIVEGRLEGGILLASRLIVRHGSDYRPPNAREEAG